MPEAVPGKDRPPAGSFLSFSCFSFPSRLARRLCAHVCTSRYSFRKKTPNSSTYFLRLRQLGQVSRPQLCGLAASERREGSWIPPRRGAPWATMGGGRVLAPCPLECSISWNSGGPPSTAGAQLATFGAPGGSLVFALRSGGLGQGRRRTWRCPLAWQPCRGRRLPCGSSALLPDLGLPSLSVFSEPQSLGAGSGFAAGERRARRLLPEPRFFPWQVSEGTPRGQVLGTRSRHGRASRLPVGTGPGRRGGGGPSFPAPPGSRSVGAGEMSSLVGWGWGRQEGTGEEWHQRRGSERHTDARSQRPRGRGTNGRRRWTLRCVRRAAARGGGTGAEGTGAES